MICGKCMRFNMSDVTVCAYCGAELKENEAAAQLKSFAGKRHENVEEHLADNKKIEDKNDTADTSPSNDETEKIEAESSFDSIAEKVSFEDGFEMEDITLLDYESEQQENVYTNSEKKTMRNTALLAVILAVLLDAILVVWMVVYFRGLAERIVNVNQEASLSVQTQSCDDIYVNGRKVLI